MRRDLGFGIWGLGLCLALPLALGATDPNLKRAALRPVETAMDNRLLSATGDDPVELLGATRGLYLEGYGAVFTTEISLIVTPGLSPFRQQMRPEDVTRVHDRKLKRVPLVRQAMKEMMTAAAAALDAVPPREQIVLSVRSLYQGWEDTAGLPSQIVMKVDRATLLKKAGLDSAIQTENY